VLILVLVLDFKDSLRSTFTSLSFALTLHVQSSVLVLVLEASVFGPGTVSRINIPYRTGPGMS